MIKLKFFGYGSFLVLVFILTSGYAQEKCKKLGSTCSKKCDKVLICLEPNEEAFDTFECETGTFCEETEYGATCTASSAQCSGMSVNVICGSEGRFPHPTQTNAVVVCPEPLKSPSRICRCPPNLPEVNQNDLTLPCQQIGPTPSVAVDCDAAFTGGLGTNFWYFCKGSDTVIMAYKAGTRRGSLINTKPGLKCEPYSSS